jgi:hypothetical protein
VILLKKTRALTVADSVIVVVVNVVNSVHERDLSMIFQVGIGFFHLLLNVLYGKVTEDRAARGINEGFGKGRKYCLAEKNEKVWRYLEAGWQCC